MVFWPGARVDARAYVPLLRRLSADGYLVVVVKEPFGISFFNPGAATDVITDHPQTKRWVVAAHSLGGVTAASYAEEHGDVRASCSGRRTHWAAWPTAPTSRRGPSPVPRTV